MPEDSGQTSTGIPIPKTAGSLFPRPGEERPKYILEKDQTALVFFPEENRLVLVLPTGPENPKEEVPLLMELLGAILVKSYNLDWVREFTQEVMKNVDNELAAAAAAEANAG